MYFSSIPQLCEQYERFDQLLSLKADLYLHWPLLKNCKIQNRSFRTTKLSQYTNHSVKNLYIVSRKLKIYAIGILLSIGHTSHHGMGQ